MIMVSLAVILMVSVFLVFRGGYEDGVLGRVGLLGLAFAAFVFLFEMVMGIDYDLRPGTVVMIHSIAIFLGRHCYRFMRFSCAGRFAWRRHEEH